MLKKAWNKISHFHIIVSLILKANKQIHFTLLSCLIQTFTEWKGINRWFANLMIQYWNKIRQQVLVCLSLICEAILLTGNIPKYHSKTAFKIFLISVGMTSEVLTTLSKVKIRFCERRWRRFTVYIWSNIRWNIFWDGLKEVLPLIKSIFMLHVISMFSQGS